MSVALFDNLSFYNITPKTKGKNYQVDFVFKIRLTSHDVIFPETSMERGSLVFQMCWPNVNIDIPNNTRHRHI